MKYSIGTHTFDSERLIFYPSSYDEYTVSIIESAIPSNDRQKELSSYVSEFDPNNMQTKSIFIYHGGICLTYNCQLRCNYCIFRSQEENKLLLTEEDIRAYARYLMKNIAIRKLVSGSSKKLHLFFSGGGEPTYYPNFFRTAVLALEDECMLNGVELTLDLTTNGIISESMVDFVADHFRSVMISYDGTPALQNQNRRTGTDKDTSQIVERRIRLFCEKRDKISTTVRTTLWHPDIHKMNEIATYIYENFPELESWSALPILATGRAGDIANYDIFDADQYDFAKQFMETQEMIKQKYGKTNFSSPMFFNKCSGIYCGQLEPSAGWLMPGGNIISCLESKEFSSIIGNIHNGIVDISKTYKSLLVEKYKEKFEECRNCMAYRFCKGGCPLKFLYNDKASEEAAIWECKNKCNYWKYIFTKILSGEPYMGWNVNKDESIENITLYRLQRYVSD